MALGQEFFWTVVASTAGTSALLALALWLFKAQIAHWLNKDIEAIKARHQRDLESYKVSLIAETERTKADQEVRKAMAVRIADKKFQSIDRLHLALESRATSLLALMSNFQFVPTEDRLSRLRDELSKHGELALAIRLTSPFLSMNEVKFLTDFSARLTEVFHEYSSRSEVTLSIEELQSLKGELFTMQIDADRMVAKYLNAMLQMSGASDDPLINEVDSI